MIAKVGVDVVVVVVDGGLGDVVGGGCAGGVGVTPVPVSVTVCTPFPSFPSSSHCAVAGPADVGANSTVSLIELLPAIVSAGLVPASCMKGSVSALNTPDGGVDEVTSNAVPP